MQATTCGCSTGFFNTPLFRYPISLVAGRPRKQGSRREGGHEKRIAPSIIFFYEACGKAINRPDGKPAISAVAAKAFFGGG